MAFAQDLLAGLSGFARAFAFVRKHRMAWMFLFPVLLWVLLTYGLVVVLKGPVAGLEAWVGQKLSIPVDPAATDWWTELKGFVNGAREMILGPILKLATGYLVLVVNKYVTLILLSPLLAYASERAEGILTQRTFPFSWSRLLVDAWRGAILAARNGALELGATLAIWTCSLVLPVLAPFALVLLFLLSSYFYGFSMFDYVNERKHLRIRERVKAVNGRLGAVLANGALFDLFMHIPLVGILFAPVLGSVAAVITTVHLDGRAHIGSADRPIPQR